jgi:polyribonucleotide nucleotidyltransferase
MAERGQELEVVREIGGRKLIIRTGKLAKQAAGAVWVQYGDTVVLVAAAVAPCKRDIDFFPLFMDYREKQYAAGKVPRGFFKREGRPTEKEILTMRLMDRPVRPLFPDGYREEVQLQAIVLSFDQENDSDILAMIGASACLCVSPAPFDGPVGAVRIGRLDGQFVVNPTITQLEACDMDVVLAGTATEINMIEVGSKEVSESDMIAAFEFGHQVIREIVAMQSELVSLLGLKKSWTPPEPDVELTAAVGKYEKELLKIRRQSGSKLERAAAVDELKGRILDELSPKEAELPEFTRGEVATAFDAMNGKLFRLQALEGVRPDGRKLMEIRPISCEVGMIPRTHGSAVFTRGETQALVTTTLGTGDDQQVIDGLAPEYKKRFMLQYNFPPFSVGEVRPIRGPGRREIGHGNLAERCLERVIPAQDKFAYTMLVVSEILESNGSSSMATVCGATLAMMDAGIPITDPVAGISIGLVLEKSKTVLLTDIAGEEDHYGDMDYKIAGTQKGITGIQLDIKVKGIPMKVLAEGLEQARQARLEILKSMLSAIPTPREKISDYAPRLLFMRIDPEKIGKVIGPGGKMIKSIQEESGARIEIEDDGTVMISCLEMKGAESARERIEQLTEEITVGRVYTGTVVSLKEFGAFIELPMGQDGLCHISEISDKYVKNVDEVVKVGDTVKVKVIMVDPQGRIKLSRKAVMKDEAGGGETK